MCCLYLLVARHFLHIIFTSNSAGVFFSTIICLIDFTLFNIQYYFVVDMHILYSYFPQYHSRLFRYLLTDFLSSLYLKCFLASAKLMWCLCTSSGGGVVCVCHIVLPH